MIELTPQEIETARSAIEDELVSRRDSRIGIMRGNGLCIKERDGEPSGVIRMSIQEALEYAIEAINAERANKS